MTSIDRSKPVLVTGATGYIAGHLVKRLLDDGFTVHAAVRDPSSEKKLRHLNRLAENSSGQLRYFVSDLLKDDSYADAMADCELVFHTASPCQVRVNDPQKDLIQPALYGTQNVLKQAQRTPSVRRIVMTSSCAAIYGDNIDVRYSKTGRFTEADWNTTSSRDHQPYSYSKVLAEREAWSIHGRQKRWDLICVNPSIVIGPGINPQATSASFSVMRQFINGTMKAGVPDYGIGAVDVRDVADAHMKAAFNPEASGRYLVSAWNTSFPEIARVLRDHFGNRFPVPKKTIPRWLVWLVGPLFDRTLTRRIVSDNVGHPFLADNSRCVQELGMTWRPFEESIIEFFEQLTETAASD